MKLAPFVAVALAVVFGNFEKVDGHVALTFPPARKYDLDFLDSTRTEGACGMNKGTVKTSIVAGQPLRVTWHLGYPHGGGFNLEILDKDGYSLVNLTGGFQGQNDKYAQQAQVEIPSGLTCPDCTIRLIRQATEWGKSYQFRSCADVEIVSDSDYHNTCSNHGNPSGSSCSCQHTYFGDQCQYKNDCETEADCNYHGQCLPHGGTSNPQKECYCDFGYYGQQCQKISPMNSKYYNASLFHPVNLNGDDVKFLWRYLDLTENEMEGILIVKTNSYVAIGWRPDDLDKSCQKFPDDAPKPRGSDFHPMDCQDIVIGKVKGDRSNIGDYYTRDRSTPRRDEFYGGGDDLLGAVGWEEDGYTTIWFRKKVDSGHKADHEFYGRLKLIWAYGRSDEPFYTEDELKYHGGNRGHYPLPFASSAPKTLISTFVALLLPVLASLYF